MSMKFGLFYQIQVPKPWDEDSESSATRPCGSIGIGGRESFMKFCLSSSGCETRPAKGEPARAGS